MPIWYPLRAAHFYYLNGGFSVYDHKMREDFKEAPKSVVAWLIMGSWLYYYKPNLDPILEDATFDNACKWLYENYDKVEHKYKHLIKKDDLKQGSLYSLGSYDYPGSLIWIAEAMSEEG